MNFKKWVKSIQTGGYNGTHTIDSGMLMYLHHRNSKLFFHPAKFDNFKDEKISDYKTVSVSQCKSLLD